MAPLTADDIGEYCRRVEDYLTRANAGHLVRIVGPGFELVREWAMAGVPLSIVYRGIDDKAERHREGQARRPLRIEFCESDVRALYEGWRRAIGLSAYRGSSEDLGAVAPSAATVAREEPPADGDSARESKRPSLTRHLDRAIDKLGRVGGRLDLSSELRDVCDRVLQSLVELRGRAAKVRGDARLALVAELPPLDTMLADAVRQFAPASLVAPVRAEAAADLAPYRHRLAADAFERSLAITIDRMMRDRLGLPLLDL